MKRRRNYIIGILFLASLCGQLSSCADKRPEGILTQAEMVRIMEDIYLVEEKVNNLALSRDSAKVVFKAMGEKVFDNAAVSDSVFKRSFDYYMERPREMELIYTALVDSLQLREQRAPLTIEHE